LLVLVLGISCGFTTA
jgi:hypothetical protein